MNATATAKTFPLQSMTPGQVQAIIQPAVARLLAAQVKAEAIRKTIDARHAPIFAKYEFYNELETRRNDSPKKPAGYYAERRRLTNPDQLYLSTDEEQTARYYAECDAANRAAGYDGPADTCPALVAEHEVIRTENALIEIAAPLLSFDENAKSRIYGDLRKRLLETLIGLAVCKTPVSK